MMQRGTYSVIWFAVVNPRLIPNCIIRVRGVRSVNDQAAVEILPHYIRSGREQH